MNITAATILAAQGNDLEAMNTIVTETEPEIAKLAFRHSARLGATGTHLAEIREEVESITRVYVWEFVRSFEDKPGDISALLYRSIEGRVRDAITETVNPGADLDAIKLFVRCVKVADGDTALAESLMGTLPEPGRRVGPDRASAARMAFEGLVCLDAPAPVEGMFGATIGELLTDESASAVPDDLVEASDRNSADRKARTALVHATLALLSERQRDVLKARNGFPGFPVDMTSDEIREALALEGRQYFDAVTNGEANFRKRFPIARAYSGARKADA